MSGMSGMPCGINARCRQIKWSLDLLCGPTRARHRRRSRQRCAPMMHRVSIGHEVGVQALAEPRNAREE
ncbi:UNVERIFIED_CONTAM: hypothetical protein Sangu_1771100 [Sesamum angustifolium]|uniref:Uncharacterized protein n=1 Tax=Sesamum angustifolium TaxID=2727405 RepID=A0AAW2M8U8_9LAMI